MGLRYTLPATSGFVTPNALGSKPYEADYDGYAVTPSDAANLTNGNAKGLFVTGAGTVSVVFAGGATGSITSAANSFVIAGVQRVNATGTTATGIVSLY